MFSIMLLFTIISNFSFAQEFDFSVPKATIGGYGELHYNYEKLDGSESKKMLDFHRFVMFFGYNFNEKWSFKSEIELEHNYVKDNHGEIELEQAYVNYHHANYFGFQAGVLLVASGLINEYHEPPTFFGVERPEYHNRIIPTTWYGNGAAVYGSFEGFNYKLLVMEGLDADKFSPSTGIRGGRQKGYLADAQDLLYNVKVDYSNIPGLRLGASFVYNNATGDSINNAINLMEFHAHYAANDFYGVFEVGNVSFGQGNIERAFGYYVDLGYNVGRFFCESTKIIPFLRYSDLNNAAATKTGGDVEKQYHLKQLMVGVSVLPIDNVVFKADYSVRTRELGDVKTNLFNLGVGYMF